MVRGDVFEDMTPARFAEVQAINVGGTFNACSAAMRLWKAQGIRGDIVSNRAAKALAAFEGRTEVAIDDVYRVIPLCLRHRLPRTRSPTAGTARARRPPASRATRLV